MKNGHVSVEGIDKEIKGGGRKKRKFRLAWAIMARNPLEMLGRLLSKSESSRPPCELPWERQCGRHDASLVGN